MARNASRLALVDSPGWIAYLANGPKADLFAPYLEMEELLLVPGIVIYEVLNKLYRTGARAAAARFQAHAFRALNPVFDTNLAIKTLEASTQQKLSLAAAMIFVTAQSFDADLVSSDPQLAGLPGVVLL
jgi:predicted nucleic acid-binding protein